MSTPSASTAHQGTTATDRTPVPQLRLPGQAAAPEGPVDMTMMYVAHHGFRRDLAAFAEAVPRTPVEDRAAWRAMVQRWAAFAAVLHHHHHGEDEWLWPELMRRVEPHERATLEAMEAEHGEIDPLLQACGEGLATMARGGSEQVRSALAVRLVAARESLARHLAHEETETIAMLQRVLTQQEWEDIDEHFKKGVSLSLVLQAVPFMLQGVPAEVRDGLFAEPGGRMHQLVWLLTRRRFERQHRQAFAHLG